MDEFKLFVGAVPYGLDETQLRKTINTWSDAVVGLFYRGTGFCVVEFKSVKERNRVFESHLKTKKAVANHVVDIKPFVTHNHLKIGKDPMGTLAKKAAANTTTNNSGNEAFSNSNGTTRFVFSSASATKSSLESGGPRTFPVGMPHQSGVITGHIDNEYVLIRTPKSHNGFAHVKTIFYCNQHKIQCNVPDCPDYKFLSDVDTSRELSQILPLNTQLSFFSQHPPFAQGTKGLSFQVQLAWPSLSRKPDERTQCPNTETLKSQARDILVKINRTNENSNTFTAKGGAIKDSPSTSVSGPPPGFAPAQYSSTMGTSNGAKRSLTEISLAPVLDLPENTKSLSEFFAVHLPSASESSRSALVQAILGKRPIAGESADKFEALAVLTVHNFMSQHNIEMEKSKKDNLLALLRVLLHQISPRRSNSLASEDPLKRFMDGMSESSSQSSHMNSFLSSRSRTESPLMRTLTDLGPLKLNLEPDVSFSPLNSITPEWLQSMARDILATLKLTTTADEVANALFLSWGKDNDMFHQLKRQLLESIINMSKLYQQWTETVERTWQLHSTNMDIAFMVKFTANVLWTSLSMNDPIWNQLQTIFCNVAVKTESGNIYNARGIVVKMDEKVGLVHMAEHGSALIHADIVKEQLATGDLVKVHVIKSDEYSYVIKLWHLSVTSDIFADDQEPLTGPEYLGSQHLWTKVKSDFLQFAKANNDSMSLSQSSFRERYDALLSDAMAKRINNSASEEDISSSSSFSTTSETLEKQRIATFDSFLKFVRQPKLNIKPIEHLGIAGSVMVLAKMGLTCDRLRQCYSFRALLGSLESFEELVEARLVTYKMTEMRGKFSTFRNVSNILSQYFSQEASVVEALEKSRSSIDSCEDEYPFKFRVVVDELRTHIRDPLDDVLTVISDEQNIQADTAQVSLETNVLINELKNEVHNLRETVKKLEDKAAIMEKSMNQQDLKFEELSRTIAELLSHQTAAAMSTWSLKEDVIDKSKSKTSLERKVVCIKGSEDSSEIFEILTDDQQQLSVDAVKAIFPTVNALKYKKGERGGTTRILNQVDDYFDAPDDGWTVKGRVFIANTKSSNEAPSTAINGSGLLPGWSYPPSTGLGLPTAVSSSSLTGTPLYGAANNALRGFVGVGARAPMPNALFQYPRL